MSFVSLSICHLSLYQYAIVCLNARLSWVPFANVLTMKSIGNNNVGMNISENQEMKQLSTFTYLDFEEIVSDLFCLNLL